MENQLVRVIMMYLLPAATVAMFAYVFWLAAFRMRRDRVWSERERSRGKFAFRPKERVRFLLGRSFEVKPDRPEWEESLVSSLATVPVRRGAPRTR